MNKIEQIEKLLKQWKACKPPEEDVRGIISIKKCKGGVIALEQALAILNEPSNKVVEDRQANKFGEIGTCGKSGEICRDKTCDLYTPAT